MTTMSEQKSLKRERHLKLSSITATVLGELSQLMEIADLMMTSQGQRQLRYYGYDLEEMHEEMAWRKKREAINRLRRQKLLECREVEGAFEVALTKRGAQEALRLKIMNAYVLQDGANCMVVFDIPEHLRKVRIELGKLLDSAGFIPVQKSVWISPYEVAPLLVELFRSAGLKRDWVRVYYAKEQL